MNFTASSGKNWQTGFQGANQERGLEIKAVLLSEPNARQDPLFLQG